MNTWESVRLFFSSLEEAAQALLTVIEDAEVTTAYYDIGGLSAQTVLSSGLLLQGDIQAVLAKVQLLVPGVVAIPD